MVREITERMLHYPRQRLFFTRFKQNLCRFQRSMPIAMRAKLTRHVQSDE